MRRLILVAMLVPAMAGAGESFPAYDAWNKSQSVKLEACLQKNDSTLGMRQCSADEVKRLDKKIHRALKKLPVQHDAKAVMQAMAQYRQTICPLGMTSGGTVDGLTAAACALDVTSRALYYLEQNNAVGQ